MLFLLTGCFLMDTESGTSTEAVDPAQDRLEIAPSAAAPQAEPAPPEVAPPTSLTCSKDERVRVQCELATGKKFALCEADGALSFRYGHPDVELAFPATGHGKDFTLKHEKKGEDREVHTTEFQLKDYVYTITSERNEDQFDVLFVVKRGEQRLSRAECTTLSGVDFTELPSL